jgi:hypothetical protein
MGFGGGASAKLTSTLCIQAMRHLLVTDGAACCRVTMLNPGLDRGAWRRNLEPQGAICCMPKLGNDQRR